MSLTLNQAYLWRRKSFSRYPWERKFLNIDFLDFEKKRINDVRDWWGEFYKKNKGDLLSEVLYYVIPAEFSSDIKASISNHGNYYPVQLSALKNSEQMGMLMILPRDKKSPPDYSLIRVSSSRKDVLINLSNSEPIYVINAEDYELEDSSRVYLDLPSKPEKDVVYKFIKENLIQNDDLKAKSFQMPISSAPFIQNKGGGISLSSYSSKYSFSQEFLKTLKMIQPPEFTDIFYDYPDSVLKGKVVSDSTKGVSFKLGDFPSPSKNRFSCFNSQNLEYLDLELRKKEVFNGEYSIACSLNETSNTASERLREILSNFVKTEVSNRMDIEDLKYAQGLDLSKVQKEISEDLWVQIANQRQNSPLIENFDERFFRKNLIKDWGEIFESLNVKNPNPEEISLFAGKSFENIKKVAQGMSRDKQMGSVDKEILDNSYKLFVRSSSDIVDDPRVQSAVENLSHENKNKIKEILQSSLTIKPLTLIQLFEELGSLFDNDILKLQSIIDRLKTEGMIYEPISGYYQWLF